MTEPEQTATATATAISQPVLDQIDALVRLRVEQLTATLQARLDELERASPPSSGASPHRMPPTS